MRTHAPVLAAVLAAAVVGSPALPASAGIDHAAPLTSLRSGGTPPTELLGDGPTPIPLKDQAMVTYTKWGPRFIAGQQDSDLSVKYDGNGMVTFKDLGTKSWHSLPKKCTDLEADKGVAAECTIPDSLTDGFFIQVWTRLGNDVVDGSTLPAEVRFWVLADAGRDTVTGGAGADFVNGAQDADAVHGGDGNDWLRTGKGNDVVWGNAGDDKLVCQDGRDVAHTDAGDHVYQCEKTI